MSFQLKKGVKLTDLAPQMALAALIVNSVYERFHASCTVTSANDSKHSDTSWHYKGRAMDFRTKDFNGDPQALYREIQTALGENFDVVLEGLGTPNAHIHCEYDPK